MMCRLSLQFKMLTTPTMIAYYLEWKNVCFFFCGLAKHHKISVLFALKDTVSFHKCRFNVFTEVAKIAVDKRRRFKTLT